MTRNRRIRAIGWIAIHSMSAAFTNEEAFMCFEVPDEVGSFHLLLRNSGRAQDQRFTSYFTVA
jgi:hypothetical protein